MQGAARARLAGPGGYYNAGNAFGLAMGIGLQVTVAPAGGPEMESAATAVWDYLAGNSAQWRRPPRRRVLLSGEAYHRAWAHGFPPDGA